MKQTDLAGIMKKHRALFASGKTKDIKTRKEYLKKLRRSIIKHQDDIITALHKDFAKPPCETVASETGVVLLGLNQTIKHLGKWARPRRAGTPLPLLPGRSVIYTEPYGTVLIISPWNYPFNLAMNPLIGAIAAGNTVFLKPSSAAPATASIMNKIVSEVFPREWVTVLEGEAVKKSLFDIQYDYIFFTGGTDTGRMVMQKAAAHLIPVTLELGGKSPCIVLDDADMALAARRVAWGKYFNAGQTCIGPDYLLISKASKRVFSQAFKEETEKFYTDNPAASRDFARIINGSQFARLQKLLKKGTIIMGGQVDAKTRYIAPTLIDGIKPGDPVMQQEIFGPILPVLTVNSVDEAVAFVNSRPRPLALYVFTKSKKNAERVIKEISFGGGCVNDALLHFANDNLPFGGVGLSGMGTYHGRWSFDTFTHYKSIYKNGFLIDNFLRYPPYSEFKLKLFKFLFK